MLRLVGLMLTLLAFSTSASAQTCEPSGLSIQVLGSGGPMVNPDRASASYLVWVDGRARVLVDAGGGAFLRFGQAGGRLEDLVLIGISHLHPDHVSDLPALLWLSDLARKEPLPIAGPTGGEATPDFQVFLQRLFDEKTGAFPLLGGTLRGAGRGAPLSVTRLDAARGEPLPVFDQGGIKVTALAVPHGNVPTLAFKVQAAGVTAVFSSDQTGTNPRFTEFARTADMLVMHLTIGVGASNPLHASPEIVGRVARQANARRLILSHIGQFDLDAAVGAVKKEYLGPVIVGKDLQCTTAPMP